MAKSSGLGDGLILNGYDLSGDVGAVQRIASPKPTLDVTGLNSSAHERIQGPGDGGIDFNAFFNDATGQEHLALKAKTDPAYVMYLNGSTLANPCAMLVALQTNYDWSRGNDGSLVGSIQTLSKGHVAGTITNVGLEWGKQVTAGKITHASATSSTGDVTTQSTAGAAAQLQISSIGSGTPTFLIEDSSDTTNGIDGVWATLITFTINTANTGERLTVSGTVDKGLRARTTGTFTNAVFVMGLRRGTAQDVVAYA